jgi:hypothetical protein
MRLSIAAAICLALPAPPVPAQGLIGGFFQAAGRAIGITPLEDLGRNMDAEHKRFKDNNQFYKQLEENISANVRDAPYFLACTWTFESVIGVVRKQCGGFNAQAAYDPTIIPRAKQRLIDAGVLSPNEFEGVAIWWCGGSFKGGGIAPNNGEIILNPAISADPLDDIAATLAHEMFHIRQYRAIGSASFKCNYAQQYIACQGCQDERHPIERDAFQFQADAERKLSASMSASATIGTVPSRRQQLLNTAAKTYTFLNEPLSAPWSPPRPKLLSDGLTFGPGSADPASIAERACTLGGRVSPKDAERCTEDLTIIYEDFLATVEDDFSGGNRFSVDHYLRLTRADRTATCAMMRATHRDPEMGRRRQGTCETISRSALYKTLSYALEKYRR